ncbi:MAG: transposase [Clostridium sp.]|nr:transposase [Clostridium sp.]
MKGKSYTKDLESRMLREAQEVGNVSLVARRHGVPKSTIFTCIKNLKAKNEIKVKPGRKTLIGREKELEGELTEVTKENDQLKKLLGEKDLEIAILKGLIKKTNKPSIRDKVDISKKYIDRGYNTVFILKVVKLGRLTYYYNLSVEGNEKAKPKGGKHRGYSLDKENKRYVRIRLKSLLWSLLMVMILTMDIEK